MTERRETLLFIGLLFWGAFYVYEALTYAGLHNNKAGWLCAIATAGVSYLSYFLQLARVPYAVSLAATLASAALGFTTGILLLVG